MLNIIVAYVNLGCFSDSKHKNNNVPRRNRIQIQKREIHQMKQDKIVTKSSLENILWDQLFYRHYLSQIFNFSTGLYLPWTRTCISSECFFTWAWINPLWFKAYWRFPIKQIREDTLLGDSFTTIIALPGLPFSMTKKHKAKLGSIN